MKGSAQGIDPKGWYEPKEALVILDIARTTFYRYIKEANIRAYRRKVGGKKVYSGRDLIGLITGVARCYPV